jgi:metallo-beta-lactamase class B
MPVTLIFALAVTLTPAPMVQAAWTQAIEPFEIADDLYYVGTEDLAAYLFTSDEGHILIDVPLEENVDLLLRNIRGLGFDPADIEVLLASHAHFDHVGGLARMRELTGARVVLSAADADMAARGGVGPAAAGPAYPAVRADRTIGHLDTVELGPWTLTAQVTAGHTPGCTSWSGRASIGGAPVAFVSVCSLSVLPGFQLVGANQTFPGMGAAYCRSLATLEALQPDLFLGPHGSFIGLTEKAAALRRGDSRAFVDPDGYRAYLDRARGSIERTLGSQGHTGGCAGLAG